MARVARDQRGAIVVKKRSLKNSNRQMPHLRNADTTFTNCREALNAGLWRCRYRAAALFPLDDVFAASIRHGFSYCGSLKQPHP